MNDSLLAGRQILVIEDEMIISMLLQDMLDELGCKVVAATARTADALAAIEKHVIDAAILDLNLNGERSYGVADALTARGVPYIFSTGYSESTVKEAYRQRPILNKPFRRSELARALTRVLAGEPQA